MCPKKFVNPGRELTIHSYYFAPEHFLFVEKCLHEIGAYRLPPTLFLGQGRY